MSLYTGLSDRETNSKSAAPNLGIPTSGATVAVGALCTLLLWGLQVWVELTEPGALWADGVMVWLSEADGAVWNASASSSTKDLGLSSDSSLQYNQLVRKPPTTQLMH